MPVLEVAAGVPPRLKPVAAVEAAIVPNPKPVGAVVLVVAAPGVEKLNCGVPLEAGVPHI